MHEYGFGICSVAMPIPNCFKRGNYTNPQRWRHATFICRLALPGSSLPWGEIRAFNFKDSSPLTFHLYRVNSNNICGFRNRWRGNIFKIIKKFFFCLVGLDGRRFVEQMVGHRVQWTSEINLFVHRCGDWCFFLLINKE